MFKLQKLNIIKIVDSPLKRDKLVEQGFAVVQAPVESLAEKEEIDDETQSKKTKTSYKPKKQGD